MRDLASLGPSLAYPWYGACRRGARIPAPRFASQHPLYIDIEIESLYDLWGPRRRCCRRVFARSFGGIPGKGRREISLKKVTRKFAPWSGVAILTCVSVRQSS